MCFYLFIFAFLDICWLTSLLIQFTPMMEIDLLPFPHTYTTARTHTYTFMHSNLHLKFSIGTEVSIPQAYVPFTLKARLHQEGYIETCEWLLDIPAEELTVNWRGNMSFCISMDSQCKNELHLAHQTVQTSDLLDISSVKLLVDSNKNVCGVLLNIFCLVNSHSQHLIESTSSVFVCIWICSSVYYFIIKQ